MLHCIVNAYFIYMASFAVISFRFLMSDDQQLLKEFLHNGY